MNAAARLRRKARQRGAAVLMALFIAALATLIVTGLFWNQFVVLRTIENQQLTTQSGMLLSGALDWARAILRTDTNGYDAPTEPWAQPLAETPLDQLGETSQLASRATIAGQIEDAQARLNLRSLIANDGQIAVTELEALRRLCVVLDVPPGNADLIAAAFAESWIPPGANGVVAADSAVLKRPLPLTRPLDLYGVRGLDPQVAARLLGHVTILPASGTAINVNSATAEVIAARIGLPLASARAVVATRDRIGYFKDMGDFRNNVPRQGADLDTSLAATISSYFVVRGQVRLDRAVTRLEALVFRPGAGGTVRVLWQRELS